MFSGMGNEMVLPASSATSIGWPRWTPFGDEILRMGHAVMDLNHQFPETPVHAIAYRLDGADIGNGTAPDFLAGLRVVIGRSHRFDEVRAEPAVAPRHTTERVIVRRPKCGFKCGHAIFPVCGSNRIGSRLPGDGDC